MVVDNSQPSVSHKTWKPNVNRFLNLEEEMKVFLAGRGGDHTWQIIQNTNKQENSLSS